jgi:hypothetical protein
MHRLLFGVDVVELDEVATLVAEADSVEEVERDIILQEGDFLQVEEADFLVDTQAEHQVGVVEEAAITIVHISVPIFIELFKFQYILYITLVCK